MRKIILFIASSLDGFIAKRNGNVDWLFMDADYGYSKFYSKVDTVIMGRKTYEKALEFEKHPFKGKKAYVFTRKSSLKAKNIDLVSDPVTFTKKLKGLSGNNIWLVGGSDIISILMNAELVDKIVVSIHPILLGKGIPLFQNIKKEINLSLAKSVKFDSGLLQLHYDVK